MLIRKLLMVVALVLCSGAFAADAPAPPAPAAAPAAAPAPAPVPAPAPSPAAAPAPAAPAPKDKSLMESLGGDDTPPGSPPPAPETPEAKALAAAEKDTRRPKHVPAKYWDHEKGAVRDEAAFKSLGELETRMRTVGLPPKEAGEYKFEVPKELKDRGVDLDPAQAKAFREQALAMGLTQKQYEGVMGLYFGHMKGLSDQVSQFSTESARTELMAHYKTEDGMRQAVRQAYQVYKAFADESDMKLIDKVGNIPAVIRVLSKIWPEMQEDPGVNPDAILDAESLQQLMRGKPGDEDAPYWNPKDARHAATLAKVERHHAATAATRQRKAA